MNFTRTPGGMVEKWRFYPVPTVWVEGPSDHFFYEPILSGIPHRLEAFHGFENSKSLINGIKESNYPYIVVLDGDYSILKKTRSPHRQIIRLSRYSIENYLWEAQPINLACKRACSDSEHDDLLLERMKALSESIKKELHNSISLDVASRLSDKPIEVLPKRVEILLKNHNKVEFCTEKISEITTRSDPKLSSDDKEAAKDILNNYLALSPITNILKGHLLFGLLRILFKNTYRRHTGRNLSASDDVLMQLFSDIVWRECRDSDHLLLKRKLRKQVRAVSAHM